MPVRGDANDDRVTDNIGITQNDGIWVGVELGCPKNTAILSVDFDDGSIAVTNINCAAVTTGADSNTAPKTGSGLAVLARVDHTDGPFLR